ncbi:MAG: hypothetical protein ACK55D_06190 [Synechococcaceae cyanobacterium]
MSCPALVSFLGFPGWGPLHLQLGAGGDPAGLARRLRRAQAAVGPSAAPAALLAAFLRQQGDGQPLPQPWGLLPPGGRAGSHRYRIVCGPVQRAVLRGAGWTWCGPRRGWQACAAPLPLGPFLARFGSTAEPSRPLRQPRSA